MPADLQAQTSADEQHEVEVLTPAQLVSEFDTNICAPMVRYSKLPFRRLVAQYNTHITTTPMILSREFSRNQTARDADFTTSQHERAVYEVVQPRSEDGDALEAPILKNWKPHLSKNQEEEDNSSGKPKPRLVRGCLIAQFAANDPIHLAEASELIRPYVDAIDINCGCPQKWAYAEGIGSFLLRQPQLVKELVRGVKSRLGEDFPLHIKIRVDTDVQHTETLVSTAIAAGADLIAVHGRTRHQSSEGHPVSLEAIRLASELVNKRVPVVANGDVWSAEDARRTREVTGVKGVMSARGLLANPALFAGYTETPKEVASEFVQYSVQHGLIFPLFHRHCFYMMENSMFPSRGDRIHFNSLPSHASVIDYMKDRQIIV